MPEQPIFGASLPQRDDPPQSSNSAPAREPAPKPPSRSRPPIGEQPTQPFRRSTGAPQRRRPSAKRRPLPAGPGHALLGSCLTRGVLVLDPRRPLVIGRQEGCGLVLAHDSVSRRHVRIEWKDGAYRLQDLGSTNGVLVSGESPGPSHLLIDRDVVCVGAFELEFRAYEDLRRAQAEAKQEKDADTQRIDVLGAVLGGGEERPFRALELLERLHLIHLTKANGTLVVKAPTSGEILLEGGQLVGAHADGEASQGRDAAWALLAQPEGHARFVATKAEGKAALFDTGAFLTELRTNLDYMQSLPEE